MYFQVGRAGQAQHPPALRLARCWPCGAAKGILPKVNIEIPSLEDLLCNCSGPDVPPFWDCAARVGKAEVLLVIYQLRKQQLVQLCFLHGTINGQEGSNRAHLKQKLAQKGDIVILACSCDPRVRYKGNTLGGRHAAASPCSLPGL
jgi:hypothetical protein